MQIRLYFYLFFSILILLNSCNTSKNPFGKRSPHEKYGDGLNDAGLKQTQLGTLWFNSANKALQQPQPVSLPYKETGYFAAEQPTAGGYIFSVRKGENIVVHVTSIPQSGILFFTELWDAGPAKSSLLTIADTLNRQIIYTVKKDQQFIVRLQPELLRSIEYTITISTAPSLAFPVDKSGNPKLISFWGAGRDAGARKHEGIDIAARFRTPALAAANGVTRVTENNLGGKVVFLNDDNTGYSLYYAHLDSQTVNTGQRVRTGEVIGLVGITGNAQHTTPHLHFGIYTMNGAIDPLAFIDPRIKEPAAITASLQQLNKWLRTTVATNIYESAEIKSNIARKISRGDALLVVAAADDYYKIQLPDGLMGFVKSNSVTNKKLSEQKYASGTRLLDAPDQDAPAKKTIDVNHSFDVLGTYQKFYLVKDNNFQGWVLQ